MTNNIIKAANLLLSATSTTANLDDIYDYLYAAYRSAEAEQVCKASNIRKALRHYEQLDA